MFSFTPWRRWAFKRAVYSLRKLAKCKAAKPKRSFIPELTSLEDRTVPSTLTVTNTLDGGMGSLRNAITNAQSGDTIVFKNVHGSIKLTSGELDITKSLTIDGPGAHQLAVSGNDSSRVFEIQTTALNVTIDGLTITNGRAPDLGGGILNDGSNLTLSGDDLTENVVFESATDGAVGGGLLSLAGTVTITNCTITGNQARGAAGASAFGDALGGGIGVVAGSANIDNSTLSGNLAIGGDDSGDGAAAAGGIFTVAPTRITNSTISDNLARGGDNTPDNYAVGGGLELDSSATITGSTFSATIAGCTFSDNQAIGGNGGSGIYVGTSAGGAIANYSSACVTASTFDQNQVIGGNNCSGGEGNADPSPGVSYGGAIYAATYAPSQATTIVAGSNFSQNQAIGGNNGTATGTDIVEVGDAEGGAICNQLGAVASFTGCTFDHNQAQGGDGNTGSGPVVHAGTALGGAINASYGGVDLGPNTLNLSNSTVTQNNATGGDNNSGSASYAGLIGAGVGAGIANYLGSTANVSGSDLDHGQASGGHHNKAGGTGAVFAGLGAGGGIFNYLGNYSFSGYGPLTASVVSVTSSIIDQNQAQGGGGGNGEGGGFANLLSATTTVASSVVTQNQTNGGGGAGLGGGFYNDATSSLALMDTLVTQNQANGSPGIGGGVFAAPGGTFTYNSFTIIFDNHADTSGDNIGT